MSRGGPPPDDRFRCTATSKRSGERCKGWRVKGTTVCATHGVGKNRQGRPETAQRSAARHRAAEAEAHREAERMVARAGIDADPIEHLMDSLYRVAALVDVYGRMVADLDVHTSERAGTVRGLLGYTEAPATSPDVLVVQANDDLLGLDRHGAAQLHPFVVEYHRLLEVRAKLAKLATDAGVQERQIRIAEEVGTAVAQAIRGTLEDLGIEMTAEVGGVVRKHLQLVQTAS